jgi:hypothetical protein
MRDIREEIYTYKLGATTPRTRFEIPILKEHLLFNFAMIWAILDVTLNPKS